MYGAGHFNRLNAVVAGLAARGHDVHVFTAPEFAGKVRRAGARFVDVYRFGSLDDADPVSLPRPCRIVSWTARFAEPTIAAAAALRPALVVADSFAVVGRVVARRLEVPWVNVCAGHDVRPETMFPQLANDPRVALAPACGEAAEILRDRYGLADASPFSYVSPPSPHLNVYCEPPEFLTAEQRAAFEPVVYFGSLLARGPARRLPPGPTARHRRLQVYASFGTIAWRYFSDEAIAALAAVASAAERRPELAVTISLGGADVTEDEIGALRRPGVSVRRWVDQRRVLARSDLFITHHGLNSTHEGVWHGVPMISHPFFWDQPALAARCRELGLAVPLVDGPPRCRVLTCHVDAALDAVAAHRPTMTEAIERAARWEERTIRQRPSALARIESLI